METRKIKENFLLPPQSFQVCFNQMLVKKLSVDPMVKNTGPIDFLKIIKGGVVVAQAIGKGKV